jgi:hypothetical protein
MHFGHIAYLSSYEAGLIPSPYDGLAEIFREKTKLEQDLDEKGRRESWTKYGGVVVTKAPGKKMDDWLGSW